MVSVGIVKPSDRRPKSRKILGNFRASSETPYQRRSPLANARTRMNDAPTSLLAADEPEPVTVTNASAAMVVLTVHLASCQAFDWVTIGGYGAPTWRSGSQSGKPRHQMRACAAQGAVPAMTTPT